MLRKILRFPANALPTIEVLAVGAAVVLVLGLFVAMIGGGAFATGTLLTGPGGCTARVWRNPVTGRDEALRGRLDARGLPVCR